MTDLDDKLIPRLNELQIAALENLQDVPSNLEKATAINKGSAWFLKIMYEELAKAGYVKTLRLNNRTIVANGKDNLGYIVYYPDEVMTGQEWYKRWEDEMQKASQQILSMTFSSKEDVVMKAMDLIDDAAKTASGIDNLKENT